MSMIKSWADYKKWISDTVRSGSEYYFRGQEDPNWKLQTSFHRYAQKSGITLTKYIDEVIPEISNLVSVEKKELIDLSDSIQYWSLLAKLQHHGFPTPLLDWSLSPYIATFFAFKDIDSQQQPKVNSVAIYIFDFKKWKSTYDQAFDLKSEVGFVSAYTPPAFDNLRMIRQMAVTTVTNVVDLEQHLLNLGKQKQQDFFYKVTLPVSERKLIMNELNLMGINAMTMFPGIDGVCSSMKEKIFNNLDIQSRIPPPPPIPVAPLQK